MLDDADWKIFIPVASAFIGAVVGGFSTQLFAKWNRESEDLLKEVRSANAACTMAYSITDSFITMKRDITKPLLDNFMSEKERYEVAGRNFIPGVSAPVEIKFDLGTFKLTRTPSTHLQDIVYKSISAPTRAISAMAVLDRTIAGLNDFHEQRNALCEEFRLKRPHAHNYFGIQKGDFTDARYSTAVTSIASYTDDAIFLSKLLGDDLRKYANRLKANLPERLKSKAPIITSADFSKAADIIPDPENYPHWQTMFISITKAEGVNFWKPTSPDDGV
jgi:hypothetical protein